MITLGFLAGDIADIAKAARLGYRGIELMAHALGDAKLQALDGAAIARVKDECARHGVDITALAFYDLAGGQRAGETPWLRDAYERLFDAASSLGIGVVASMSGFDRDRDWNGNLALFAERFGPIAASAERRGLRIALENWAGLGGRLPHVPVNMGGCPDTWDDWFRLVPSPALGLEFDPSHLVAQGIDPVRALREYAPRVHHVHAKDTELLPEARYRGGRNADGYRFRIPGYGVIDWTALVSILIERGYAGGIAVEHEDPVFSGPRYDEGLRRARDVLAPLIGTEAPAAPRARLERASA
jgi:sugar phosphate isomerase/epimerase